LLNAPSVIAFVPRVRLSQAVVVDSASNLKANAMTEYQNIATGLLGLTHPEIYLAVRKQADKLAIEASSTPGPTPTTSREANSGGTVSNAAVRAVKFAFAALVAGSRAVPLGDNSQLTRELGAYGEHLRRCG
jgi:hypothetical protein